jgi:hypothetical protein
MNKVVNTVQIHGPLEPVFDLMTTTRFWPQWHPATVGVGGVTERPFGLGDKIRERAKIGPRTYEGTWTVVEYSRPSRAMLQGESGRIQITYSFQANGPVTELQRELEFYAEDFSASAADPSLLQKLMHDQSEQALQKLKALVETILHAEARLEIGA